MSIVLDKRLQAAADLIRPGGVVADIGTDHAYLICYLVGSGKCRKGYACDINEGPLRRAAQTIGEAGLAGKVHTVLANGLEGVPREEVDDIAILGMGGELIGEILTGPGWTRDSARHFVLQPMTKAEELRRLLYREGFAINAETAVDMGKFIYSVFSVSYTGERREIDDLFAWTGRVWYNGDNVSGRYLERTAARLEKIARGLARSRSGGGEEERFQKLAAEIRKRVET